MGYLLHFLFWKFRAFWIYLVGLITLPKSKVNDPFKVIIQLGCWLHVWPFSAQTAPWNLLLTVLCQDNSLNVELPQGWSCHYERPYIGTRVELPLWKAIYWHILESLFIFDNFHDYLLWIMILNYFKYRNKILMYQIHIDSLGYSS